MRNEFPEGQSFTISSKIFNVETHSEEINSIYKCYYQKETESLLLFIDETVEYANFSKDMIIDIIDFSEKLSVKLISFLICKKNPEYNKYLQGLLTIGFQINNSVKSIQIEEKLYRVLSLKMNKKIEDITEIDF